MSILNRFPVLRWRAALVGVERSLRQAKRELADLRRRYEDQEARLTAEKQKRVRLESKLTRRRERRAVAASRAAAADASSATVVSYPKSGRTWFAFLYYYYCLELLCERHLEHEFPIKPELDTTFHQLLGEHPELPRVAFSHCGMAGKKSYHAVSTDPDQFLTKPTVFILHRARPARRSRQPLLSPQIPQRVAGARCRPRGIHPRGVWHPTGCRVHEQVGPTDPASAHESQGPLL